MPIALPITAKDWEAPTLIPRLSFRSTPRILSPIAADRLGGRFVTVRPRTRKEDARLREWMSATAPEWTEAHRRLGKRKGRGTSRPRSAARPSRDIGPVAQLGFRAEQQRPGRRWGIRTAARQSRFSMISLARDHCCGGTTR
jgi:hypothetical protein